ncbi:S-layer homology domain-containing protein [Paenibacillus hexagrammi]|uniref:S-layer homology domain-containing protein n=1 Tax=Paenibacillus hexagrammi TaxID=2908839 RepID=A0ABY3SNJ4_9BACL|nr:S-layer homology domain-containing protein [Paenibacillus sp. YPD9-1]UJF35572.1 S-layer homology domain-containing protein [Paenibacillus sp. YPD9-1]
MISLRRWTTLLLAVLICFGVMISSAFASPLTVSASFDVNTGKVTILGTLGTEQGSHVTVQVIDPNNQLNYLDQTSTGANGSYQFSYLLKKRINGTYFVNVDGQLADQAAGTTFAVRITSSDGNGNNHGDDDESSQPDDSHAAGPSTPPASTSAPSSDASEVKLNPDVVVDQSNGNVTAKLDEDDVAQAIAAGGNHFIVDIQEVEGAKQYHLDSPASIFSAASNQKLTMVTKFGSISIPSQMLSDVDLKSAKVVGLTMAKAVTGKLSDDVNHRIANRPVMELSVTVDGKTVAVHSPNAMAEITVPYQPSAEELKDPEHIVVWNLDDSRDVQPVPSGKYDVKTGTVTFKTTSFGMFAVAFVKKSFSDLDSAQWAKGPIEVMASKGVISGISATIFNPNANITRADFMILLTRAFQFNANVTTSFKDVRPTDYYYEAVGIAKQLGLAEGQGDGLFNPTQEISRQDMMVLLSRAMRKAGLWAGQGTASDLEVFADKSNVAAYAVNDVAALIKGGIVEGSAGKLNPTDHATRAEAAVLLYRMYNN